MGTLRDLTGHRFGRLVGKSREGTSSNRKPLWLFDCDCGGSIVAIGADVVSGRTTSCWCLRRELVSDRSLDDLRGKTFGRWTVVSKVKRNDNRTHWLCACECGSMRGVAAGNLRSGLSISCGCWQAEQREQYRSNLVAMVSAAGYSGLTGNSVRRARILLNGKEAYTRSQVWEKSGGVCWLCHELVDPKRWDVEHVHPIFLGGPDILDNVEVAHPRCNKKRPRKTH